MALEPGDLVLCTVDRIIGTTVFVNINDSSGNKEGTIITSEIAPGRIRNLRDYVVPKKKIVCKVLRVSENQINLSLRRVTQKEKKEVMEKFNLEKSYENILKSILGEDSEKTINEIRSKESLYDFIESAKQNPKELEKLIKASDAKRILEIINEQKKKIFYAKNDISLTTIEPNGLELIKELLQNSGNIKVKYISAGKYTLEMESSDSKKANIELREYTEKLEKKAKEKHLNLAISNK